MTFYISLNLTTVVQALSGVRINKSIGSRGQSNDWGLPGAGVHDGADAGWQGCAGVLPAGRSACHLATVLRDDRPVDVGTHRGGLDAVLGRTARFRAIARLTLQTGEKGFGEEDFGRRSQLRCALLERCGRAN